ncbi:FG-GAP-like repeat-containing protein [Spirillospora sp. CA-294931]|uniref:FG-GAP-like repeat-containing protein n=1 Tax=Spirillospora sp. CA-294931 TaxID=3240042 RepID=UPI003D939BAE
MRIRSISAAATVAAGAAAVLTFTVPASDAASAPRPQTSDFNGDGHRDLVIGSPEGYVKGHRHAGFVTVVYGGPAGPDTRKRQHLDQDSPGVPGAPAESDQFASAIATADFDGDRYSDLAIGTPFGKGVVIVYGGPKGLTARTVHLKAGGSDAGVKLVVGDFNRNGVPDLVFKPGRSADHFMTYSDFKNRPVAGTRTSASADEGLWFALPTGGDFTGDGYTDLAMQVVADMDGHPAYQYVELRLGSPKGLGPARRIRGDIGDAGVSGDVNGDGKADLIARGRTEDTGEGEPNKGAIKVFLGTATGLGKPVTITQDTPGVPGTGEKNDEFGAQLAVGDVNGDRRADVAVGAPLEDIGKAGNAGSVTILYGGPKGLTAKGAQGFSQDTKGIPGTAERGDYFGQGLSVADLNRDGRAEVSVGAPMEDTWTPPGTAFTRWEGRVYILRGAKTGVTLAGLRHFGPDALGLARRNALLGDPLLP